MNAGRGANAARCDVGSRVTDGRSKAMAGRSFRSMTRGQHERWACRFEEMGEANRCGVDAGEACATLRLSSRAALESSCLADAVGRRRKARLQRLGLRHREAPLTHRASLSPAGCAAGVSLARVPISHGRRDEIRRSHSRRLFFSPRRDRVTGRMNIHHSSRFRMKPSVSARGKRSMNTRKVVSARARRDRHGTCTPARQ